MRGFKDDKDTIEKCCGTCRWHTRTLDWGICPDKDGAWVCKNGASIYCQDKTDYRECCTEWEARE